LQERKAQRIIQEMPLEGGEREAKNRVKGKGAARERAIGKKGGVPSTRGKPEEKKKRKAWPIISKSRKGGRRRKNRSRERERHHHPFA